ncbi:MAG: MoxR-like ATPase [Frankiales bacterium]|nr:MoxR-like ATPase [Frankiales bacterium]
MTVQPENRTVLSVTHAASFPSTGAPPSANGGHPVSPTNGHPHPISADGTVDTAGTAEIGPAAARIIANIEKAIAGKSDVIRLGVTVLLAEGHLLIEDVPGVGKTTFAKALARSIDSTVRRIQFTPDLMPSDVTGVSIFNTETSDFEFKPGPVFANILLGDEINRASPKTQAALLECMAERQVTVDGTRYELSAPFIVLATQNPIEMEGTYALPEAQRDRFTAKISLGYPDRAAELAMLSDQTTSDPLDELRPVADAASVRRLIEAVRRVQVVDAVKNYVVSLAEATRNHPEVRLGASPRASLHLLRTAKAAAAIAGRDYVIPDDVQRLAVPVLAHRLIPAPSVTVAGRSPEDVLREIVARTPIPIASPPVASAR